MPVTGHDAAFVAWLGEQQRLLRPLPINAHTARDYRLRARWWELEARRPDVYVIDQKTGETNRQAALRYARTQRWSAELVGLYGEGECRRKAEPWGTCVCWLDLLLRAGVKHPGFPKMDVRKTRDRVARYGRP